MIEAMIQNCLKQNKIAYQTFDDSLTFQELYESSLSLAIVLNQKGSSPVLIYGHKQKEMLISIFACLLANRAYVPIDDAWPVERILEIMNQTQATCLIEVSLFPYDVIEKISPVQKKQNIPLQSLHNEIAYIIFTSGSSGKPKGIPITYENCDNFSQWIAGVFPHIPDSILSQASFSFDLSVVELICCLRYGSAIIACDRTRLHDYGQLFQLIDRYQPSSIVATPTFLRMLLLNKEFDSHHYPFIDQIYCCGEMLLCDTALKALTRFEDLILINAYGPSEATSAVSAVQINQEMCQSKYLPVGDMKNLACEVTIINDEIVLSGKSVFHGYLSSSKNIDQYFTGDLGYIENDLLFCIGRKDSQIKYKGYRIELAEIEQVLSSVPHVEQCAVFPIMDSNNTVKTIKAYVTGDISLNTVKEELSRKLPAYMVPRSIKIVDQIPENANYKIDRRRLYERFKRNINGNL